MFLPIAVACYLDTCLCAVLAFDLRSVNSPGKELPVACLVFLTEHPYKAGLIGHRRVSKEPRFKARAHVLLSLYLYFFLFIFLFIYSSHAIITVSVTFLR